MGITVAEYVKQTEAFKRSMHTRPDNRPWRWVRPLFSEHEGPNQATWVEERLGEGKYRP